MKYCKKSYGFALLEILLAISILTVITVVGVYQIYGHVNNAKNNQVISNEIVALFNAADIMQKKGIDDDFFSITFKKFSFNSFSNIEFDK